MNIVIWNVTTMVFMLTLISPSLILYIKVKKLGIEWK